jgi:hypothetical protein
LKELASILRHIRVTRLISNGFFIIGYAFSFMVSLNNDACIHI